MDNKERYKRQLLIDGWGEESQKKLECSTVFVAGAGGLGCPTALNLTTAGIGNLLICDSDVVDLSNLNRQFLHTEQNIGVAKTKSAAAALCKLNSSVNIKTIAARITDDNIDDLVGDAEVIMDCLDNFEARYALNRCAIRKNIPLIHGAVWGLEGRVTVCRPPLTPCLSCLFPVGPKQDETIPVLGAVTCATGAIQAMEAIAYLRGLQPSLQNKMLIMDYSTMYFQTLTIPKKPDCPVCSHL